MNKLYLLTDPTEPVKPLLNIQSVYINNIILHSLYAIITVDLFSGKIVQDAMKRGLLDCLLQIMTECLILRDGRGREKHYIPGLYWE